MKGFALSNEREQVNAREGRREKKTRLFDHLNSFQLFQLFRALLPPQQRDIANTQYKANALLTSIILFSKKVFFVPFY